MNVYRRYFKITSGELFDAVVKAREVNKAAKDEYEAILTDLGAVSTQWYQRDNRIVGLIFEKEPDRNLYKKLRNSGWWPKKNNKAAKEIFNKIASVKTAPMGDMLRIVGLPNMPTIFGDRLAYSPSITVIPSEPIVIFVSVPWYDESPEKIEQYKSDRAAKIHFNGNIDSILWEPVDYMVPIKEWEMKKAIEEWNDSVRHQVDTE